MKIISTGRTKYPDIYLDSVDVVWGDALFMITLVLSEWIEMDALDMLLCLNFLSQSLQNSTNYFPCFRNVALIEV